MTNLTLSTAKSVPQDDRFVAELMSGEVVVNIGQVGDCSKRTLDKLVRQGVAVKWRGKWYPVAGAAWGLGPDKTCWGLKSKFAPDRVA